MRVEAHCVRVAEMMFIELIFTDSTWRATRTRTNTNPNGTEENTAGRSIRACVARESTRQKNWGVGGRAMRLMGGRGVGECGSGRHSYGVA
jgi:hypothetical protein